MARSDNETQARPFHVGSVLLCVQSLKPLTQNVSSSSITMIPWLQTHEPAFVHMLGVGDPHFEHWAWHLYIGNHLWYQTQNYLQVAVNLRMLRALHGHAPSALALSTCDSLLMPAHYLALVGEIDECSAPCIFRGRVNLDIKNYCIVGGCVCCVCVFCHCHCSIGVTACVA